MAALTIMAKIQNAQQRERLAMSVEGKITLHRNTRANQTPGNPKDLQDSLRNLPGTRIDTEAEYITSTLKTLEDPTMRNMHLPFKTTNRRKL